ncbi:MAG TPA: helix-turn-helix domain-containing protein [Pseudonocardiaceae bacterium]|jgi:sugar diacid utilization regulator|nr:helix-turn-helix domain-containing protein [Pseudonocardiaceae bacterium]
MSELRLTVLTGQDRLDRVISRIYGTELPDPGRFLAGGELVLSGLLWLRGEPDVAGFVAALADAGVAALVACDADTGVVPAELVAECARRGVPLLRAEVDLSFSLVIDRVGLALAAERIGEGKGSRRGLISAMAGGAGIEELLRLGVAELGARCWVLSTLGRLVAGEPTGLTEQRRAALVRDFLLGNRHPARSDGFAATLFPVDDPSGPDLTRWLLVVAGAAPVAEDVVAELASVLGVQRARERENRRATSHAVDTLLELVLSGSARSAEIVSTASAAGLDASADLRVLTASAPGSPVAQAIAVLAELVALLEPAGLVSAVGEDGYALLPWPAEGGAELTERIGTAIRMLEPGLGERRIVLGISSATSLRELPGAIQEAGHARQMATRRGGRARVVAGEEIAAHQLLLAVLPGDLRRSLRRRVLGPVLDYDAEHGGSLIGTLSVFLDCAGSWAKAAAALHVHVNTLRYRISRIEELADVDLDDFAARVDVYLALHADP